MSIKGYKIAIVTVSKRVRRRSAFCDGGSDRFDVVKIFTKRRWVARAKRMGKIVKVYRKESKQTAKPKPMI